ncbi:MAG: hypothetical protein ACXWCB_00620 [Acidimicrobiales bacterium]
MAEGTEGEEAQGSGVPLQVDEGVRPRHRRRWLIAAAVLAVVLVAAGWLVWAAVHGGQVHQVEVQDAVDRYRAGNTGATGDASQMGPAPGVYQFSGSGTEKLSLQTTQRQMGPSMPVTLTRDGDECWWFRIEYHDDHWQSWHYCFQEGQLLDLGGQVHQRFDFGAFNFDSDSTSVCEPPSVVLPARLVTDDTWTQACTVGEGDGASPQEGPATYLGEEVVPVGGAQVRTYHLRWERTFTGGQSGHSENETWFAMDTLMPVRNVWSTKVDTASPVGGTVTYDEQGTWQLDVLAPTQ